MSRKMDGPRNKHGHLLCLHGRVKYSCTECVGSQVCNHKRIRSTCKECEGREICEHNRRRTVCKDCGGGSICEHKRKRYDCKECGGLTALAKALHDHAKCRARYNHVAFDITVDDILKLVGDGVCPVFNTPFELSSQHSTDTSASLDKFYPNLGYVRGNCYVISLLANRIKQNVTSTEIRKVADWMVSVEKGLL